MFSCAVPSQLVPSIWHAFQAGMVRVAMRMSAMVPESSGASPLGGCPSGSPWRCGSVVLPTSGSRFIVPVAVSKRGDPVLPADGLGQGQGEGMESLHAHLMNDEQGRERGVSVLDVKSNSFTMEGLKIPRTRVIHEHKLAYLQEITYEVVKPIKQRAVI